MLNEAKKLYRLGYAIHWLHPKSKRPIHSKWTTGERASLEKLTAEYKPGFNIGVRLGRASKVQSGYLSVIDCDVKSKQDKHVAEMLSRLHSLYPKAFLKAPIVHSGRGNGSRHYYIVTEKPVASRRLAQSAEKVEVHMPSSEPSNYEKKTLPIEKLNKGIRLRAAWEISFMGEGSQVVLPPSLHPDTGNAYAWDMRLRNEWLQAPPVITVKEAPKAEIEIIKDVAQAVNIDLELGTDLDKGTIAMIREGEGVEDRSASLLSVAMTMIRAGLTDIEILSILSDPNYYLGKTAYEHAKTKNRKRAMQWLERFTLRKAKNTADASKDFEAPPPEKLSEEEALGQFEDLKSEIDWRTRLERGKDGGKPKCTLKNVRMILENAVGKDVFKKDCFADLELYGCATPWGGKLNTEIKDSDLVLMKCWLADHYRIEPPTALINEAVTKIALKNAFHPVQDYILSLHWDGVPRVDSWLKDYLSAKASSAYLAAVSRKVLVAMVARAFEPGRKFDQVLILQGEQGYGKSTALRNLVSDKWFTDANLNVGDKDGILAMRSVWLWELGELSGMRKADVDLLKEFISRTTDRIRVPYGRRTEAFPRQCVFIGTTNRDEFLKDDTGNRRFWPVTVGRCNFKAIEKIRDQLFAEAFHYYTMGEPLYLQTEEEMAGAVLEQRLRMESDSLTEVIENFIENERKKPENEAFNFRDFSMHEALTAGMFGEVRNDKNTQMRAASALRSIGYKRKSVWSKKGQKAEKRWVITT